MVPASACKQPDQHLEHHALADARAAADGQHLAAQHLQIQARIDDLLPEGLLDALELDDRLGARVGHARQSIAAPRGPVPGTAESVQDLFQLELDGVAAAVAIRPQLADHVRSYRSVQLARSPSEKPNAPMRTPPSSSSSSFRWPPLTWRAESTLAANASSGDSLPAPHGSSKYRSFNTRVGSSPADSQAYVAASLGLAVVWGS